MNVTYSEAFFDEMEEKNLASARVVVPLVLRYLKPKSIVDIGCGRGLWLKAFREKGIEDTHGYDGDYVDRGKLAFPAGQFHAANLEELLDFGRTFDLAVCLEVAEHLPPSAAETLVKNLVEAAPVILFSAAIPLQGGSHHVNEQWPAYWAELFARHNYVPVDCIRRTVWDNEDVSYFYAQNIFFFVRKTALSLYPDLGQEIEHGNDKALSLVHPYRYSSYAERWRLVVPYLSILPSSVLHVGKRLLKILSRLPIVHVMRYLISGSTAAAVYFAALYGFVEVGKMYYLLASALALTIAIVVSFSLHKFFTFREHSLARAHIQFGLYLLVIALDYVVNLALLWLLVELLHVPYLLAAFIATTVVATINFFAYWLVVFRRR